MSQAANKNKPTTSDGKSWLKRSVAHYGVLFSTPSLRYSRLTPSFTRQKRSRRSSNHLFRGGSNKKAMSGKSKLSTLIVLLVLIGAVVLVNANQNRIFDYFRLRGYVAPSTIAQLATQDTMNPYTRHLFYLNKPQLLPDVTSFRKDCPENQDTIVLGCYHPDQDGIYIYNVQDSALAGVQQVTAAHEVLHSVYARLSTHDRTQLDNELMDYYQHDLTDARVKAEVKIYQDTEPHDVMDEMSCTYGTEVASLPPALEAYYKKYFTNRAVIVAYEQQYETQFTQREATIAADDTQLSNLKNMIDSQQSALSSQLAQITAQRAKINGYLTDNDVADYNADVPAFNAQITSYNNTVSSLQAEVASYNQQVVARNLIAGQLTVLDKALDTRTVQTVSH
jgi:hypothetical protein